MLAAAGAWAVGRRALPRAYYLSLSLSMRVPISYSSIISYTLVGCCGPWNPFEQSPLRD